MVCCRTVGLRVRNKCTKFGSVRNILSSCRKEISSEYYRRYRRCCITIRESVHTLRGKSRRCNRSVESVVEGFPRLLESRDKG